MFEIPDTKLSVSFQDGSLRITADFGEGKQYDVALTEIGDISKDQLDQHITDQASLVAWFSQIEASASTTVEDLKNRIDMMEEELHRKYYEVFLAIKATPVNGKDATDKYAEAAAKQDEAYKKKQDTLWSLRSSLVAASSALSHVRKVMLTLEHRKEMLIQLSQNNRRELRHGIG